MASGGEGDNLEKKKFLLRRRRPLSPGLASGHVSLEGGGDCCEKSRGGVFMHEMGHFWASRLREKNVIGERGRKREHFHRLPLTKQRLACPEQLHSCPNNYLDSGKTFLIIPLSFSRNFSRRRREGSSVSDFYDQGHCLRARLSSFKKLHLSAKRHFSPDSGSFTTLYLCPPGTEFAKCMRRTSSPSLLVRRCYQWRQDWIKAPSSGESDDRARGIFCRDTHHSFAPLF